MKLFREIKSIEVQWVIVYSTVNIGYEMTRTCTWTRRVHAASKGTLNLHWHLSKWSVNLAQKIRTVTATGTLADRVQCLSLSRRVPLSDDATGEQDDVVNLHNYFR